jgi:hypothetical protein
MPQGERDYLRTYQRKPRDAVLAPRACQCPGSPFCRGPASADWLTCLDQCKACRPPQPKRKDLDLGVPADE